MNKIFNFLNFRLVNKIKALKNLETYLYLVSGLMIIIGYLFTPLNYFFYLSFIYPTYTIYKNKTNETVFFYYLLPYFMLIGFGVWNYIFPYYLGLILSILLADLISKIINQAIIKLDSEKINVFILPSVFFVLNFIFQEIPRLRYIELPPFLAPIYNHTFILKISSIFGNHVNLFLIITFISCLVSIFISKRHFVTKTIILITVMILIVLPNFMSVDKNSENNNVKIAAVQGKMKFSKSFNNYTDYGKYVINKFMQQTKNKQADIFVFPEFRAGCYDNANIKDKFNRKQMTKVAKEKNALMLFTVDEFDSNSNNKEKYLSSILVSKYGVVGKSRKRNLTPFSETKKYLKGTNYEVIDTKHGKIGISICYDMNYGTIKNLKENKAQIILAPFNDSGFGKVFHNIHRHYPIINAVKYNVPIVVANYNGMSQIINSNGKILDELDINKKDVIIDEINLKYTPSYYLMFGQYIEIFLFLGIILLVLFKIIKSKHKKLHF